MVSQPRIKYPPTSDNLYYDIIYTRIAIYPKMKYTWAMWSTALSDHMPKYLRALSVEKVEPGNE